MTRPSWPRLVGIQFVLIFRSGRWIELVGGVATLLSLVLYTTTSDKSVAPPIRLSNAEGPWMVLVLFLVAAWPALLWRGESPRHRRYHWSLPVARGPHDLARVAAGGLWVLIVAALMAATCGLMFPRQLLLASSGVLPAGPFLGLAAVTNSPGRIVVLLPAGLSRNVGGYCLGLVTVYGLSSIAAVVAAKPARWLFGTLLGYVLVSALLIFSSSLFGRPLARVHSTALRLEVNLRSRWNSLMFGKYGLVAATGGSLRDGEGALVFDFVAPGGVPNYGPDSILASTAASFASSSLVETGGRKSLQLDSMFRAMALPRIAHAGITVRQPHAPQDWYENSLMIYNLSAPAYVLGPAPPATVAAFDSRFAIRPLLTRLFDPEWAAASALWLVSAVAVLLFVSASRHEH